MMAVPRFPVYIFLLLVFSFVVFGVPSTECTEDPGAPGCQKPFYTDDQSSYLFDLTSSWVFSGFTTPDDSGPTVFEGGQVTLLGVASHSDEVFGSDYLERYVEDPGEAEDGVQEEWGRGSLTGVNIDMDDSKEADGRHGDKMVNPPYEGMCGDGLQNVGDEETCPEDHGTPTPITLDFLPPESKTIEYDEADQEEPLERSFGKFEQPDDIHIGGYYSGVPDYHTGLSQPGIYIYKDEVEELGKQTLDEGTHIYDINGIEDPRPDTTHYSEETITFSITTGPNSTESVQRCAEGDRTPVDGQYVEEPDFHSTTDTFGGEVETYEAVDNYGETLAQAEITYNEGYTPQPDSQHHTCSRTSYNVNCKGGENPIDVPGCEAEQVDVHESSNPEIYAPVDTEFEVTTDQYSINRTPDFWGPVNRQPDDLFGSYPEVDVVDTDFGYHTEISDDGKQGSNNPSVSANRYRIEEQGEGQYFHAVRETSNVGNADGSDGELNGVVAYHETHGVKGGTIGFGNETWNGNRATYVTMSSIEDEIRDVGGCPGDTVRCVASIDIRTAQSGWGTEPLDSYEISLD